MSLERSKMARVNLVDGRCRDADTYRWYQEEIARCGDAVSNMTSDPNDDRFSSEDEDITYVHDPINEKDLQYVRPPQQLGKATGVSDLQQLEQECIGRKASSSPVLHRQRDGPSYCQEADDEELLMRNFVSDPAQKSSKRTKTIFSVAQSMKCSDQDARVANNDNMRGKNHEPLRCKTRDPQKTRKNVGETKEQMHDANVVEKVKAASNTLVFQQCHLPMSKVFTAAICLENPRACFLGYRVFCNATGAALCTVTPRMGIIPPRSEVLLKVQTKSEDISSERLKSVKFSIKMFPKSESVKNMLVYFDKLSKEYPELICTQVMDNIMLHDLQDGNENANGHASVNETLLEQYSNSILQNSKTYELETDALVGNQELRNGFKNLQCCQLFQNWTMMTLCVFLLCLLGYFVRGIFRN